MSGPGDVPLDHDLVLPLELLEDEGAHDAVTHHEGEEADVREEETAVVTKTKDVLHSEITVLLNTLWFMTFSYINLDI